ncbi:hypothetical protein HOLleu_12159 [Holothuria leucospilota]|uniref:MADF domain-containing protein n=1 Tax=Holothuria leucospilota TaxID=206669 RepID=A0A9Q1CAX9_HOLLE|nr:hypothetical protein HOLleu_12159 [Holothuria leucospilota]
MWDILFIFPALEWKKKWRNQRDTYMKKRREVKSNKSGQVAERAKKWHFFEVSSFLDTFIEENNTDSVPFFESGCALSLEDELYFGNLTAR